MTDKILICLVAQDYGITKKKAKELIKTWDKELLKEIYMKQCKLSFYND